MSDRDEFLDRACSGIRDRRTREKVREELSSHIDDRAGDYALFGDGEEQAESRAVADMGDPVRLSRELAEVHSFFPLRRFKNSLILFAVGFLLVSLQLDVWIIADICTYAGTLSMLVACFNLKSGNRLLFAAFALSCAGYVLMTFGWLAEAFPQAGETGMLNGALIAMGVTISCIRMCVFGYGIAELSQGKAAKRARRIGWIYLAANVLVGIACFFPDTIWLAFAAFAVAAIVMALAIFGVSSDIWRNDREVVAERHGVRAVALMCAFVVLLAAAAPCVRIAFNCQPAKTTDFVVSDLDGEGAKRAEEVRAQIGGQTFGIGFADELIADAAADIAQSDLLRLDGEGAVIVRGEPLTENGRQSVNLYFCRFDGDVAKSVTVLSVYRYLDGAATGGVCQTAFSADGLEIVNDVDAPAVFVNLCTVDGRKVRTENSFEFYSGQRVGAEFGFVRRATERSGYAIFDIELGGRERFLLLEQCYTNSNVFRKPYNRQIIEYGQTDEYGWNMVVNLDSAVYVTD